MTREEKFIGFAIIWGAISSCIVLVLIQSGIRSSSIFAIKDLPIYLGAIVFSSKLLRRRESKSAALLIFLGFGYLFINYAILNPLYNAPINNIRQILAPLVLLFIFTHLAITEEGASKILNLLCWVIILVFGFGILEQAMELWPKFDLSTYFRLKGIPTDENGVSYMFYEPMFGYRERMTSTFLDPVSVGHFFSSSAIFLYYLNNKKKLHWTALLCCIAGMFFALSKGAIIQFIIGVILFNSRIDIIIKILFAFITIGMLFQLENIRGILIHIHGFQNSLKSLTLFGYGIGSVGNYAKMFSDNLKLYNELQISDTYVGALIGQIGFIGTSLWILTGKLIINLTCKKPKELEIATKILLSIFVVSILSENTMNVTSFALPAAVAGLSMKLFREHISPAVQRKIVK